MAKTAKGHSEIWRIVFSHNSEFPYFLELWGTTRECWTYYTEATTPLFTILAHGMAAVAVWRVTEMAKRYAKMWVKHRLHK